jgi:hypothetical protein
MSEDSNQQLVPINKITRGPELQMRVAMNQEAVQEYAEALRRNETLPAVILYYDKANPTETYDLADGYHRVAAAELAGLMVVLAEVRNGTRRDAILHALGANQAFGVRRTNADKRKAVEVMLRDEQWAQWSDREIGRKAGVSNDFVGKLRKQLSSDDSCLRKQVSSDDSCNTRIGADGKSRRMPKRAVKTEKSGADSRSLGGVGGIGERVDALLDMMPDVGTHEGRLVFERMTEKFLTSLKERPELQRMTCILLRNQAVILDPVLQEEIRAGRITRTAEQQAYHDESWKVLEQQIREGKV